MIHDPAIILAEEPTNHLDGKAAAEMRQLLLELKGLGKTIVVVSHDPELIRMESIDLRFHMKKGFLAKTKRAS